MMIVSVPESAEVRRAGVGDLDTLVDLRVQMFHAMGSPDVDAAQWRSAARGWFADRLTDDHLCIVVVDVGGQVVSTAMGMIRDTAPSPGKPHGRDILISNVCTAPDARRRGYARLAFAEVLSWAHATGVARAELFATETGQQMYEAAGFAVTQYPAMRATLTRPNPPPEARPSRHSWVSNRGLATIRGARGPAGMDPGADA